MPSNKMLAALAISILLGIVMGYLCTAAERSGVTP